MPGHCIPEPFVWDESFKVFYDQLDNEHKGLFKGVFACAEDKASADKLKALYDLVDAHFTYEESEMKANKYANFEPHRNAHQKFLADLKGLSAPLSDANINFAKDWLVNHIKDIDFGYKNKLG